MPNAVVLETNLDGLTLARRGKVRDVYDLGEHLLIVATDRISAFDYILGSGIPDKGKVLTQLSAFWFDHVGDLVPHHVVAVDVDRVPRRHAAAPRHAARPVDARARRPSRCRWNAWRAAIFPAPAGRTTSRRAPSAASRCRRACASPTGCREPIFTPATKAESGHDENISEAQAGEIVGAALIRRLRELTLSIYARGVEHAADMRHHHRRHQVRVRHRSATQLILIDEVLTPDSSRFWPKDTYEPGQEPAQFRQAVRPRPPRSHRMEQAAARSPLCRTTWSSGRGTSTSKPTNGSPAARSPSSPSPLS